MAKKIVISVAGQPRELMADYLNLGAFEYWQAWLAAEARQAFNPLAEFAEKVQALPENLRAAATTGFVQAVNFGDVPRLVLLETAIQPPAVRLLAKLVTGEDIVPDDPAAACAALWPFIQRQETVVDSLAEVNRLRAEIGKPPIGGRSPQGE